MCYFQFLSLRLIIIRGFDFLHWLQLSHAQLLTRKKTFPTKLYGSFNPSKEICLGFSSTSHKIRRKGEEVPRKESLNPKGNSTTFPFSWFTQRHEFLIELKLFLFVVEQIAGEQRARCINQDYLQNGDELAFKIHQRDIHYFG